MTEKRYSCATHGTGKIRCCGAAVPIQVAFKKETDFVVHPPCGPIGFSSSFGVTIIPRASLLLADSLAEQFGNTAPRIFHDGP